MQVFGSAYHYVRNQRKGSNGQTYFGISPVRTMLLLPFIPTMSCDDSSLWCCSMSNIGEIKILLERFILIFTFRGLDESAD